MVEFNPNYRKTIPQGDRVSHLSENGNGFHPQVPTEPFSIDTITNHTRIPGPTIEITRPLIPFRVASVAGGRPFGGGTSREAQRRAKRDIKAR